MHPQPQTPLYHTLSLLGDELEIIGTGNVDIIKTYPHAIEQACPIPAQSMHLRYHTLPVPHLPDHHQPGMIASMALKHMMGLKGYDCIVLATKERPQHQTYAITIIPSPLLNAPQNLMVTQDEIFQDVMSALPQVEQAVPNRTPEEKTLLLRKSETDTVRQPDDSSLLKLRYELTKTLPAKKILHNGKEAKNALIDALMKDALRTEQIPLPTSPLTPVPRPIELRKRLYDEIMKFDIADSKSILDMVFKAFAEHAPRNVRQRM